MVTSDQDLFRKEALDAQKAAQLGSVRLAAPLAFQIWAVAALMVAAGILAWLIFGRYTRREHVKGTLTPQAGLITLSSGNSGIIKDINVREGSEVSKGARLIVIEDERGSATMGNTSEVVASELLSQRDSLKANLLNIDELAKAQLSDLEFQSKNLAVQIDQIDAQLKIEQRQVDDLSAVLMRLQSLGATGYVSALEVQRQRSQELDAEGQVKSLYRQRSESLRQLESVKIQIKELPITTSSKADDLKNQIAQNEQLIAQNESERLQVLRAPRDGTISSIIVSAGQAVQVNQSLLSIIPKGTRLCAQLLVPSTAVGFVKPGTKVILHYAAYPYEKYGGQRGTVLSISRSALRPNEVTELLGQMPPAEPLYRVQVALTKQTMMASGKLMYLKPGMQLDADLLLDSRRMIEWVFDPLYHASKRISGEGGGG